MERIEYYVQVPNLSGMTEQERARATETYMRESQKQLRMVLQAQGLINNSMAARTAELLQAARAAQETAAGAMDAIRDGLSRIGDYVTDEYAADGWRVVKWASGLAEASREYGLDITANSMAQTGQIYYIDGSVPFPDGLFTETPLLYTTAGRNSSTTKYLFWVGRHDDTDKTTARFSFLRSAQQTSRKTFYINLYARGRWRSEE